MGFIQDMAHSGPLADRYCVGFSQDIADQVDRLNKRDIQILDIKELNDLAGEYRGRIRGLVAYFRAMQELSKGEGDLTRRFYTSHEAIFVRRQITDLWKVYRILMADSHEMTAVYLARLGFKNNQASRPTGKEYRAAA